MEVEAEQTFDKQGLLENLLSPTAQCYFLYSTLTYLVPASKYFSVYC